MIQDQSGEGGSHGPYVEIFNLPTIPWTPGGISCHPRKHRRSIIIDDAVFINMEIKEAGH
jgi:hypothetical protein